MTAYGRSTQENLIGRFTAEIQSVNRKHLEITVILPRELSRFDAEVKKWISAAVGRGQITVKFTVIFNKSIPLTVAPNIPLAVKIHQASHEIASVLGLDAGKLALKLLEQQPSILLFDEQMEDEELYREKLHEVFNGALQGFLEMKMQEGHAIFLDITQKLEILHQEIKQIAIYAPNATKRYRERLVERLKEFYSRTFEEEERILREISIYAEKIDILEEITLFEAHLKQFTDVIATKNESVAKKLEFLLQEMNREVNTIGSKSSELEVSRRVVEMKSTLERIREIIQNVE